MEKRKKIRVKKILKNKIQKKIKLKLKLQHKKTTVMIKALMMIIMNKVKKTKIYNKIQKKI